MKQQQLVRLIVDRLDQDHDAIVQQWNNPVGTPTRHFVVDNLLPADIAEAIYQAFPRDGNGFFSKASFREKKKTSANLSEYPEILGETTYALQDAAVVAKVGEICRIQDARTGSPALRRRSVDDVQGRLS